MVRFAPPSKPVTLAPATEQCQIKSELIHLMGFGQRSYARVAREEYLRPAHVRKLDDTGLVDRTRALGVTFQVLLTPCGSGHRLPEKGRQPRRRYRRLLGFRYEEQVGGSARSQDSKVSYGVTLECVLNFDASGDRNLFKFGNLREIALEARDEPAPILITPEQGHESVRMSPRPVHPQLVDPNFAEHCR